MNAASQLFRVLAIIGAIAAGALFYLTNGKTATLTKQLNEAKSAASSGSTDSAKKIQDLNDQLTAAAVATDAAQKKVKSALDEADVASQRFEEAKKQLDSVDETIKGRDSKIADLNGQINALVQKVNTVDDITAKYAADESKIAAKDKQIADMSDQLAKYMPAVKGTGTTGSKTARNDPSVPVAPPQLSAASSAKVLQVDLNDGLLVLDVGADNGVQKDAQLYIKVGDAPLGVVVVSNTQAKMATCTITSLGNMSPKDFASIVKAGLKIDYQRAL